MELYFGTISIRGLNSFLEPHDLLLLMEGFRNQHASIAATNYIINIKHLADETEVAVVGAKRMVGSQGVVVMSDVNPAGPLMEHIVETSEYRALSASGKRDQNHRAKDASRKDSLKELSSRPHSGSKAEPSGKKKSKS